MKQGAVALAMLVAGLAYPYAVHLGLQHGGVRWIAPLLAALWLARALTAPASQPGGRVLPLLALGFCAVLAFTGGEAWLRAYPVLINASLCAVFGASLLRGMPVIERLARLRDPALPPAGVRYTRCVTRVWTLFFAANGLVAAALAVWAPLAWWTLYNGGISYLLMGALLAGEWLVRPTRGKAA